MHNTTTYKCSFVFALAVFLFLLKVTGVETMPWAFMGKISFLQSERYVKYQSIRVPYILALPDTTVIAVVPGHSQMSDWAEVDMLMCRGADGGKTWESMSVLIDGRKDVADSPVLIWEGHAKVVHFLRQNDYARIHHLASRDGRSIFAEGVDITPELGAFMEKLEWDVIAPGPRYGIQLRNRRLIIPVWLAEGHPLTEDSSYSNLAILADSTILCLYEHGNKYVSVTRFNLEWIIDRTVGSTYNYAAALYNRIIKAFDSGDMKTAAALQTESMCFIKAFNTHGGINVNKAILGLLGIDWGTVRRPLTPVTKDKVTALKADLERLVFFKYINPE